MFSIALIQAVGRSRRAVQGALGTDPTVAGPDALDRPAPARGRSDDAYPATMSGPSGPRAWSRTSAEDAPRRGRAAA